MDGKHPLAKYREGAGLSQEALAEKLGVSGVTVSRWETGQRKPDLELLPIITEKTGIPAKEMRPDLVAFLNDEAAQ